MKYEYMERTFIRLKGKFWNPTGNDLFSFLGVPFLLLLQLLRGLLNYSLKDIKTFNNNYILIV